VPSFLNQWWINSFLGERECKRGVFGRVKHYHAVFEAQNRGTLHMHIVIWLEDKKIFSV
jgi:hypothetical protein